MYPNHSNMNENTNAHDDTAKNKQNYDGVWGLAPGRGCKGEVALCISNFRIWWAENA